MVAGQAQQSATGAQGVAVVEASGNGVLPVGSRGEDPRSTTRGEDPRAGALVAPGTSTTGVLVGDVTQRESRVLRDTTGRQMRAAEAIVAANEPPKKRGPGRPKKQPIAATEGTGGSVVATTRVSTERAAPVTVGIGTNQTERVATTVDHLNGLDLLDLGNDTEYEGDSEEMDEPRLQGREKSPLTKGTSGGWMQTGSSNRMIDPCLRPTRGTDNHGGVSTHGYVTQEESGRQHRSGKIFVPSQERLRNPRGVVIRSSGQRRPTEQPLERRTYWSGEPQDVRLDNRYSPRVGQTDWRKEPMEDRTRRPSLMERAKPNTYRKKVRLVQDLDEDEMERYLQQFGVELEDEPEVTKVMLDVLQTQELVNRRLHIGYEQCLEMAVDSLDFNVPRIVLLLRERQLEESEIQALWKLGLTKEARLTEYFINEVRAEVQRSTVALLRELVSELGENSEARMATRHTRGEGQWERPQRKTFSLGRGGSERSIESDRRQRLWKEPRNVFLRPLKLPVLEKGGNVAEWLDDCAFCIAHDRCDDVTKTDHFMSTLRGGIRDAAWKLEKAKPDILWPEIIEVLKESHLPTASLYTASHRITHRKYDYSEPFDEWINDWEMAVRLSCGDITDHMKKMTLLGAIPEEDSDEIALHGKDDCYSSVVKYMTLKWSQFKLKKERQGKSQEKSQQKERREEKRSGYRGKPVQTGAVTNMERRKPNYQAGKSDNRECWICLERGHVSANCPQRKVRVVSERGKKAHKDTSEEESDTSKRHSRSRS